MQLFSQVQKRFLDEIKGKMPVNVAFADVLANDLNISNDSAYRRIRGDTFLSFQECMILCNKYNVSLDSLFVNASNYVMFSYRGIDYESYGYDTYFKSVVENLEALKRFEVKEMLYGAKDVPLFYLFMFDKLAAFKLFFWMSNIHHFPEYENMVFDEKLISKETLRLAKKVWESYINVPSTEIWSEETIVVTLKQIEYMYDSGRITSRDVAIGLLEEFKAVLLHIQKQAEKGYKFPFEKDNEVNKENIFNLYYNEILISDTTIYFQMEDKSMAFLGHNVMNILTTTDELFCRHTYKILNNIIRSSTLISVVAEKVRNTFFLKLINKTNDCIKRIETNN